MRNEFAKTITELAQKKKDIVLLAGDIGNRLFDNFKKNNPERFYNCGVAEANMTGVASGLASSGLRPITYTITPFNTFRCFEQIRLDVCYPNLPVIIHGGYQTRDFVYIKDVIEVIKMSMKKIQLKKFNGVFNVGTGKSVKIDDLYKLIKSKIKNNSKIVRRPLDKYDPKKSAGRFKKLQKYLNFKKNSFTKLDEGITKTIAYKY